MCDEASLSTIRGAPEEVCLVDIFLVSFSVVKSSLERLEDTQGRMPVSEVGSIQTLARVSDAQLFCQKSLSLL